jgi:hypothetical protein
MRRGVAPLRRREGSAASGKPSGGQRNLSKSFSPSCAVATRAARTAIPPAARPSLSTSLLFIYRSSILRIKLSVLVSGPARTAPLVRISELAVRDF